MCADVGYVGIGSNQIQACGNPVKNPKSGKDMSISGGLGMRQATGTTRALTNLYK